MMENRVGLAEKLGILAWRHGVCFWVEREIGEYEFVESDQRDQDHESGANVLDVPGF